MSLKSYFLKQLSSSKKKGWPEGTRHHPKYAIQLGGAELQVPLEGGSRGERIRCAQFNRHCFGVFVARKVSAFVKTGKKCEPANDSYFYFKNDSQNQPLAVHNSLLFYNLYAENISEPHPNYRQHRHRQSVALIDRQHFPLALEFLFAPIQVGLPQLQRPAHHAPA